MLRSLEKAILKYRTNQMMRLLFHMEDLKRFLVGSMNASNLVLDESDERFFDPNSQGAKVMNKVWERAIKDDVLTEKEVEDLKEIIKQRNAIAHNLLQFTQDLHCDLRGYCEDNYKHCGYDSEALERLLGYKIKLENKWKGIRELSFDSLYFSNADDFYKKENDKLLIKIKSLSKSRNLLIKRVNSELSNFEITSYETDPKNEANFKKDGSLSKRGGEVCRRLLNEGLCCDSVCILMGIDLNKVKAHQRKLLRRT
ncbi:hypothetical protein [Vibrio ostreae]|uniref:Uncharacterized protein n=1 Tax=Vibrio ostreae TaxID=2841925 RepID=A0A975U8B6_9VIBR|nr:hypothetical protein [Vibrio ostreae]QXO17005.1 hypothetical protein KNV97_16325 [Vibrio ostreae]